MTLIIAEIGINHNGDMDNATQLIKCAFESCADVAKFQLFKPELQGEHLRSVALSREQIKELEEKCILRGIKFACTAFDPDSLEWLLKNTKMAFVKIGSGQCDNEEMKKIARESDLMVIQSIKRNCPIDLFPNWHNIWTVAEYPTPPENARLYEICNKWCKGISDHSGYVYIPLAAAALGASIIECHITLNKAQTGYDHKASLEPHKFREMVMGVRAIEKAMDGKIIGEFFG